MSGKHRKFQIRWIQRDLHRDIIKMEKVKERILKATKGKKNLITYKEYSIRLPTDFQAKIIKARREWQDPVKVLKGEKLVTWNILGRKIIILYFSYNVSPSVMSSLLQPRGQTPARLLCPLNSPGKNAGVGCHFLLQGIFLTQGWSLSLLHYRQFLYCLSHQGKPLGQIEIFFSSQPEDKGVHYL